MRQIKIGLASHYSCDNGDPVGVGVAEVADNGVGVSDSDFSKASVILVFFSIPQSIVLPTIIPIERFNKRVHISILFLACRNRGGHEFLPSVPSAHF